LRVARSTHMRASDYRFHRLFGCECLSGVCFLRLLAKSALWLC
jgi:hypothetical protein